MRTRMSVMIVGLIAILSVAPPVSIAAAAKASSPDRFGLVFVYAASCPASRALSPALAAVARHLDLPVLAASVDGYRLDAWPGTRPEAGQLTRLGITRVPFVALYNAHTGRLEVIANRFLPPATLHARIAGRIVGTNRTAGANHITSQDGPHQGSILSPSAHHTPNEGNRP